MKISSSRTPRLLSYSASNLLQFLLFLLFSFIICTICCCFYVCVQVCSQTEESIGAVETIINNFKNDENHGNSLNSVKNIPVIVCMNKMDSKTLGDDVEGR